MDTAHSNKQRQGIVLLGLLLISALAGVLYVCRGRLAKRTQLSLEEEARDPFGRWPWTLSEHSQLDLSTLQLTASDRLKMDSMLGRSAEACQTPPFGVAQDRRRDKDRLRIVNFNAEWLFQYGGTGQTLEEALIHVKRVAEVLTRLNADVVHLSEVESCTVLELLLEIMPANHGYRFYMLSGRDSATGQNTALLTRVDPEYTLWRSDRRQQYPLLSTSCVSEEHGWVGVSKHYFARIKFTNLSGVATKILFAGIHLLAFPSRHDRCAKREAQAALLARRLIKYNRRLDSQVVVLGDFNDFDNECVGADDSTSITRTLPTLKQLLGLKNAACLIPSPLDRYTAWHDVNGNCIDDGPSEHSMLDHVLLSRGLYESVAQVSTYHKYATGCGGRVSDHWPLVVDIDLSKAVAA